MSYTALYRKWRPLSFDEIVGQEAIIQTLLNQIRTGRVAHAYLFCGTRGTGKTSTAKIFSRAVNCTGDTDSPPCNKCSNCLSTLDESNMDVFEMDAASNNGVDDIRELREHVKYPPANGRYKVYIIDEVHMLSKGAFNALLKTLEEPPPHILFILATTEPHKIPATIHSRCQRFDFKRVSYDAVAAVLGDICQKEGRGCEPEALRLIVQSSEGALRDALSILDRCLSFEEGPLTHERVLAILGLSGDRFLGDLTEALLTEEPDQMLQQIARAVKEGKDLSQLIKELIEYFRKLLLIGVSKRPEQLLDVSREYQDTLKSLADRVGTPRLMNWLTEVSRLDAEARWTPHPRALLEMTLIRMIYVAPPAAEAGLLLRLEALERRLAVAGTPVPPSAEPPVQAAVSREEKPLQHEPRQGVGTENPIQPVTEAPAEKAATPSPDNAKDGGQRSLADFSRDWAAILSALKKIRISTYALMVEGELVDYRAPILTVAFGEQFEFHRMAMEKEENRNQVEQAILQQTGLTVRVNCVTKGGQAPSAPRSSELGNDVRAFFKGHEDKITVDTKEDPS